MEQFTFFGEGGGKTLSLDLPSSCAGRQQGPRKADAALCVCVRVVGVWTT